MSAGAASLLGLWSAYGAAVLAQVAHLRPLDDGTGAVACGRLATGLLALSAGLLLFARGA